MGGVWLPVDPHAPPMLWSAPFAPHVSAALVTSTNRAGTLSISDLEFAGMIAHKDVLARTHDIRERTSWIAGDNRAAVAWSIKGSSTSLAARAYLFQYNALHQRQFRYLARHPYIPGPVNAMADTASRRWELSDAQLLTHFNSTYPQATSWQLFPLASDTNTALTGALCRQRQHDAFRNSAAPQPAPRGISGCVSAPNSMSLPHASDLTPCAFSNCLFAHRYRTGSLTPSRHPVRSRTVEDALRAVGQVYAGMGSPDPRLNALGDLDFRLSSLFRAWKKEDPPPSRVKPLPLSMVSQVCTYAPLDPTPAAVTAAECLVFGFYFLLRPGEYLGMPRHPTGGPLFCLRNVRLWIGSRALDTMHCSDAELRAATFVCLTFREQKNGVRNETIGHGRSGHPHLCPVHCLASRVVALRHVSATLDTPLNAFRDHVTRPFRYILASDLTQRIRAALLLHPDPAYTTADVSVRSTRAGGAMALLCAGIDSDRIRLIGRWRSDEMYRYLHVQAQPVMTGLAAAMLRGGSFSLSPV